MVNSRFGQNFFRPKIISAKNILFFFKNDFFGQKYFIFCKNDFFGQKYFIFCKNIFFVCKNVIPKTKSVTIDPVTIDPVTIDPVERPRNSGSPAF